MRRHRRHPGLSTALATMALAACAAQRDVPGTKARSVATKQTSSPSALSAPVRRVEIAPVFGHTDVIQDMALSPSKRLLVTSSSDPTMKVWNVETGALLRTVDSKACRGRFVRVADEEIAVKRCDDGTLRKWDLRAGTETRVQQAHRGFFVAAVDRDGRRALTAAAGTDERDGNGRQELLLWDLERLERVRVVAEVPGHVARLAWSDDGRHALVSTYRAQDGTALVDLESGKTLRRFEPKSENAVELLGFDGASRRAIVGHAGGPTLVFDVATGRLEQRIERETPPFVVGPDGYLLSIQRGLSRRDAGHLSTAKEYGWRGHVFASAWAADRSAVVVASADGLRVLDTGSGSVLRELGTEAIAGWNAAIAPDGLTVATQRCRFADSLDDRSPAMVRSEIDIVSLRTGTVVKTLRSPRADELCGSSLMFSARGSLLLEGSVTLGLLRVWDVASGTIKSVAKMVDPFFTVAPFPDERTALVGMRNRVARIDLETLSVVARFDFGPTHALSSAVSPDGSLIAVESFEELRVWDTRTFAVVSKIALPKPQGGNGSSTKLAFSPDGELLAIGEVGCTMCSVRLHDARTGAFVRAWLVGRRDVTVVRFIDAGRLVSADWNGEVAIWDIQTGQQLARDTRASAQILDVRAVDGAEISASRDTAGRVLPLPDTGTRMP